jgi:hypothetical protein
MTELQFKDGIRILISYETPVAAWVPVPGHYVKSERWISRSSAEHIKQWLDGKQSITISHEIILNLLERC